MKTIEEEIKLMDSLSLPETCEYASNMAHNHYPTRPKKPREPDYTVTDAQRFAFEMETYEKDLTEYENQKKFYAEMQDELDIYLKQRVWNEAGLASINLSQERKEKIWDYAWEQGHSYGYYEVYSYLNDLVDLFNGIKEPNS